MKVLAIIPARYASTRFPGKPLAELGGESLISRVYRRVSSTPGIDDVIVATDSDSVCDHVESFAGEGAVMLTLSEHRSGIDRCGEVLYRQETLENHYDVVIDVPGDEPFVEASQLQSLMACFDDPAVQIATFKTRITSTDELLSPDKIKVVCGDRGQALYFSRQPIPYCFGVPVERWLGEGEYYKHVGIYAFRPEALHEVCAMRQSPLEMAECLEPLRWLAAGYTMRVELSEHADICIDTPDDLAAAEEYLKLNKRK